MITGIRQFITDIHYDARVFGLATIDAWPKFDIHTSLAALLDNSSDVMPANTNAIHF